MIAYNKHETHCSVIIYILKIWRQKVLNKTNRADTWMIPENALLIFFCIKFYNVCVCVYILKFLKQTKNEYVDSVLFKSTVNIASMKSPRIFYQHICSWIVSNNINLWPNYKQQEKKIPLLLPWPSPRTTLLIIPYKVSLNLSVHLHS